MIEYYLFCTDDRPLRVAEMTSMRQSAGWTLRIARNWLSADKFSLVDDGNLEDDDVAIGWPVDSEYASQFDAALARGDRSRLDEWLDDSEIGDTMWAIQMPFVLAEHSEFESLDDAREQMGSRYADHLARTKCMYVVTNCPLMEFTATAMGAAALLRQGLIEIPDLGASLSAPANESELRSFLERWPSDGGL